MNEKSTISLDHSNKNQTRFHSRASCNSSNFLTVSFIRVLGDIRNLRHIIVFFSLRFNAFLIIFHQTLTIFFFQYFLSDVTHENPRHK